MDEFENIRPFNDDEVAQTLAGLLRNEEFIDIIAQFRAPRLTAIFPRIVKHRVRALLARETAGIDSVSKFQDAVSHYVNRLLKTSTTEFVYEGIEKLEQGRGYLFVGNHRDIAADSMLLDYALYYSGFDTVRIAIGDNLLQRDFATDLMRLNKSFIIQRSAQGPKKIFAALRQSSRYIHQSIAEGSSVWIAQSEGRAKDGIDRTDSAIIKMFALAKRKSSESFGRVIAALNIVPVSISYEYDPCDVLKARELYHLDSDNVYTKPEGEDLLSLVKGLTEFKGRIRLVVGDRIDIDAESPEHASELIDRQILANYQLFPPNFIALQRLQRLQEAPYKQIWDAKPEEFSQKFDEADIKMFEKRLLACPENFRPWFLKMYANPVVSVVENQQ